MSGPTSVPSKAHKIGFEDQNGAIISIEKVAQPWLRRGGRRGPSMITENEPAFTPLFRIIPELIKTGMLAGSREGFYRVTFPAGGRLMHAANLQGYRALVVNDRQRIVGHGLLNRAGMFPNAALVWQVAAAVTAQPYLNDISANLKKIKGGIEQIQSWLSNERAASLEANAKMLREIEVGLAGDKGFLSKNINYQNALTDIDLNCSKIAEACVRDLYSYISEIEKVELSAIWRSDGSPLLDLLPKVLAAADAGIFALTMRVLNTGLLYSLLNNLNIAKLRTDDIKTSQTELLDGVECFRKEAYKRITSLTEWLSFQTTVESRRNELKDATEKELSKIEQRTATLRRAMASCEQSLNVLTSMLDRPLKLDVQVMNGNANCKLSPTN